MTAKKLVLIGCGSALAVLILTVVAVGAWFWHVSQEPEGVLLTLDAPHTVEVEEDFTLTVVIENRREDRNFTLTDVDIAEAYLDNFLVLGTEPQAISSLHVPVVEIRSFTFDREVPPGGTMRIEFHLRPIAEGMFRGDLDVAEGQRFLTTLAQTLVTPEE